METEYNARQNCDVCLPSSFATKKLRVRVDRF